MIYGRIKSLLFRNNKCEKARERILVPSNNGNGYLIIFLSKNGKRKRFYIHRLVANAFIPNPENKPCVNHRDYNKQNNNLINLEWASVKENTIYSICNRPKFIKSTTNTGEQYISYKKNGNKYEVTIDKKYYGRYDNLKDAITKRNEVLNEKIFSNNRWYGSLLYMR